MKFLIFGCYALADGYKAMTNGLRYQGHNIAFFPLFAFQDLQKQKIIKNNIINEFDKIIKYEKLNYNLINYINDENPIDYIIIWHGVDICAKYSNLFKHIKNNYPIKLIQINWDPNPIFKEQIKKYYKHIDYIFNVNSKITNFLNNKLNYKNSYHFNQSHDEDYSFYEEDENYKCDVSMVLTNLYTENIWKNKLVCRKKLLDIIYKNKSINLNIYGPIFLKKIYPESYKGYIPYLKSNLVFSNSLINLNISPVGNSLTHKFNDKECYYFSERLPQILGCRGLMVCDQNFGVLFKNNVHYIELKKEEDILEIINDVKKNHEKYEKIRKNGFTQNNKYLNSTLLADYIIEIINKQK